MCRALFRLYLILSGRVQGVFFRAETKQLASSLGLTGWVRNTEEGTVEIVAEGQRNDLNTLEEWCRRGPPLSRVGDVQADWEEIERKTYHDFRIV